MENSIQMGEQSRFGSGDSGLSLKGITMQRLANIHPGEVLKEEFLIPLNLSAYRLAMDVDIPQTRLSQIIKGKRRITADTALRLSKYFGNSAKFWLGLQDDFDLEEGSFDLSESLKRISRYKRSEELQGV
jgi:antitoxin HigA-1